MLMLWLGRHGKGSGSINAVLIHLLVCSGNDKMKDFCDKIEFPTLYERKDPVVTNLTISNTHHTVNSNSNFQTSKNLFLSQI